jgi:hypothetical protein
VQNGMRVAEGVHCLVLRQSVHGGVLRSVVAIYTGCCRVAELVLRMVGPISKLAKDLVVVLVKFPVSQTDDPVIPILV